MWHHSAVFYTSVIGIFLVGTKVNICEIFAAGYIVQYGEYYRRINHYGHVFIRNKLIIRKPSALI